MLLQPRTEGRVIAKPKKAASKHGDTCDSCKEEKEGPDSEIELRLLCTNERGRQ